VSYSLGVTSDSPTSGRVLGLDAGERRIGVAISDPERRLAVPLRSVIVDGHGGELEALARLVREEEVAEVVVGLPLSLSGGESAQTARARAFGETLGQKLSLPVRFWDERLSTQEALHHVEQGRHRSGKRGERPRGGQTHVQLDTDAIAASIILQAYLDHARFSEGGRPPAENDWSSP
jgi:putative Holliday junction resolvase